ncbi:MAG: hypothetical protein HC863_01125 [Myxococcales bacterium]|nr:hypothetical protein [Myxococcales bacterium]
MSNNSPFHPAPEPSGEELLGFDFTRYLRSLRKYAWAILALMASRPPPRSSTPTGSPRSSRPPRPSRSSRASSTCSA